MNRDPESAWDQEYERGRYIDDPPVAFVDDILKAANSRDAGTQRGLYIGCGNGRNYIPLVEGGLDLDGLDISGQAISQLQERLPGRTDRLFQGDLSSLPSGKKYDIVIGIQVFQHGTRSEAHAHLAQAKQLLEPAGLFCLRVNAAGTDLWPEHEVMEESVDGGFTVRYLAGPKTGLPIHFFARQEIKDLFVGWDELFPLRIDVTRRADPAPGQWSQWEGIWRRSSN